MRWLLRLVLLLLLSGGLFLAVFIPWVADNVAGYQVGKWRVYDRATGYVEAKASVGPSEAPLWATLEVLADSPISNPDGAIVLTMTVADDQRTVATETFTLAGVDPRIVSPQSSERVYRLPPTVLREGDKTYTFVVGPGEDDFPIAAIDLTISASAIDVDPRVTWVGWGTTAFAGLCLLLTFRRKRRSNPNETPPPPRWGRQ